MDAARIQEKPAMPTKSSSHGRHGGNHNQSDELKNRDPTKAISRNTDAESRARGSNESRAGGKRLGD